MGKKLSRQIKFRGKKISTNEWVYGSLISDKTKGVAIVQMMCNPVFNGVVSGWCFGIKPETVGQFTGLKDKDGVEIYEGDQLYICAGYSSVVEFQDAMFVSVYSHPEDGEIIPLLDVVGKDTIVIGNIYENK